MCIYLWCCLNTTPTHFHARLFSDKMLHNTYGHGWCRPKRCSRSRQPSSLSDIGEELSHFGGSGGDGGGGGGRLLLFIPRCLSPSHVNAFVFQFLQCTHFHKHETGWRGCSPTAAMYMCILIFHFHPLLQRHREIPRITFIIENGFNLFV